MQIYVFLCKYEELVENICKYPFLILTLHKILFMEDIIRKEVTFKKWFDKIIERGTIINMSIKEKLEIKDDDWEVMKELHRLYFLGHLPIYENILIDKEEKRQTVTGTNLFSDNTSVTAKVDTIGIKLGGTPTVTIKKKKK